MDLTITFPARRREYLLNLGTAFEDRFDLTRSIKDIDAAIGCYEQATIQLSSSSELALALNNFGFGVLKRFGATRDINDLVRSLDAFQRAVAMTPPDSPMLALYLEHLGRAHLEQYVTSGTPESIDAAIAAGENAWSKFERAFGVVSLAFKIGQQFQTSKVTALLVRAYLTRAAENEGMAVADRRRAMEIAEAGKSRVLTELLKTQSLCHCHRTSHQNWRPVKPPY